MRTLPFTAVVVLALAAPAGANDTSIHMGSSGPEPVGGGFAGPESVIAMKAERLEVTFGKATTRMRARFTFRNTLPAGTATQVVGFPDEGAARDEARRRKLDYEGSDVQPPLRELATLVDGRRVPSAMKFGWVKWADSGTGWVKADERTGILMAWHVVTVAFPAGRDVVVERRYVTDNGANTLPSRFFEYITHTGGPWKGPIGELVAEVRLVDGLTVDRLLWPGGKGLGGNGASAATSPGRSAWRVLGRDRMRLVWRNFEPRTDRARAGFKLVRLGS